MAVPAGMVLVPSARRGEEAASRMGVALIEAARTPLWRREKVTSGVDEEGRPYALKTEAGAPAWLVAALALIGISATQRGLRTGTLTSHPEYEYRGEIAGGRTRFVWARSPSDLPRPRSYRSGQGVASEVFTATGRQRARPSLRVADSVAPYQGAAVTGVSFR